MEELTTVSEYRTQALERIAAELDRAEKAREKMERAQSMFSSLVGAVWFYYDNYAGHLTEEDLELIRSRMSNLGETPHS